MSLNLDMKRTELSYEAGKAFEWKKWTQEIPYIRWPADWEVKAVPPFAGAIIRYMIKTPQSETVSVYLDCYDMLGAMNGKPYWEVYPHEGDVFRCDMNETDELLKAISESRDGRMAND